MPGDDSQRKPVYLPWTSFENITEELRGKGMPRKLDRSVLKGKSGSTQAQYLAALRFMDMIDTEDRPTERFKAYVEQADRRPELMRDIVEEKYAAVLALGTDSTTAELADQFRQYGLSGETSRKAMAFFLNAARTAGIPVSPHWPQTRPGGGGRTGTSNGTTTTRRRARRKPEDAVTVEVAAQQENPKGRYIDLLLKRAAASDTELDTNLLDRIERVLGIDSAPSSSADPLEGGDGD